MASLASRAVGTLTLGTVAGVGGLGLALKSLANDLDALNDASDAVGDSVENLSAIESVARRNGESLDLVVTAAERLNKALSGAKEDSPVARALQDIGINAKELQGLGVTEQVQRIAVALSGFENSQRKAQIITDLFGRTGRTTAAFLGDLAAAGQLNATVTTAQANEAAKFNKQLSALSANATDAGRALAGPLLSGFNLFIERARVASDLAKPLDERISALFQTLKGIGFGALLFNSEDIDRLKSARTEVEAIEKALLRTDITEERRADLERKRVGRLQTIEKLIKQQPATAPAEAAGGKKIKDRLDDRSDRVPVLRPPVRIELPASVEALQAALRRLEQTDVAKIDLLQTELSALFELQRESRGAPAVTRAIEQLNDELATLEASRLPTTAIQDPRDEQRAAFLRSEKDAYGQVEAYIKSLSENGRSDLNELSVSIDKFAENSINALVDLAATGKTSASGLFDAFRRDALRELIEDPVRDSMRSVVKTIRDELGKVSSENPLASIFRLGAQFVGSLFSGGTGPSGLGSDVGAGYTSRALGGPVRAGEIVRWQEGGREFFRPDLSGTVVTEAQLQGQGGGSYSANYTFNIQGGDARETTRQVQAMLDERDAKLARSLRYGRLRNA